MRWGGKYALSAQPYNTAQEEVTWETCTLRQWLNDDFLNAAFTEEEQARLVTALVTADEKPNNSSGQAINQGSATYDRVYLLSYPEAEKYFPSEESWSCFPTKYAIAMNVYRYKPDAGYRRSGATDWWLRTRASSYDDRFRAYVVVFGYRSVGDDGLVTDNAIIDNERYAVRPVIQLWLSPDKPLPTLEPIPTPTPTPTPVPYPTLQKGAKGDDVKKLQQALIDGGFLNGKADGDFGNMTDAAVKAAQEAFGLEANGIADDAFQRRLYGE